MSKSLKKLIDINRLREFKNKLVGTGSAYVQTGAVNQTIAGTKTFSKPIVGSLTGNAATATTATTAKSCTGNAATATKLATARSLWGNNFDGSAAITGAITGTPAIEFMPATTANHGGFLDFHYNQSTADRTSRIIESASGTLSINNVTITTGKVVTATTFNGALIGNVTGNCSGSSGSCTGNAATATRANSAANADTATNAINATNATNATNSNAANQLQAFVNDDFTGGNHYVKAIRSSQGWSTHLWMCYNNGAKMADEVSVNYATNSGYTNWLRTSSHTDHLFHTEWDGSYFWTYVTAGDGSYRAVRVERSNSSGYADSAGSATKLTQWYTAYPDGAEAHNAMWGGRDITAAFNNGTVSANIKNGTFRDIFPGDYITKQVTISGTAYTVNWVVADCDYWWHKGDQNNGMETHHVVIVPQASIFAANMNATNTTEGGYAGSRMYRETIPACAAGIVNAFGSDHILTFGDSISNSVDTAHASSGIPQWTGTPGWFGQWVSVQCNLMSEKMVYGAPIFSGGAMDNTMATRQMSAFRLSEKLINYNRYAWWLRDVVSSANFAVVTGAGSAHVDGASAVHGVRPFALLR